jgi:hypothetical protein
MNPYLIIGVIIAIGAAAGGGYYKGNTDGRMAIQSQWDAERIKQQEAYARALQEAAERQQALQVGADKLRQEKDRETRELAARNTALTNSLRDRPERPTAQGGTLSGASGTGSSGCTPRELYRQDSEVVVRLAGEADEIRIALKQCYAQYETLRRANP